MIAASSDWRLCRISARRAAAAAALALLACWSAPASAQTQTLGVIEGWRSYFSVLDRGAVCGISSDARDGTRVHVTRTTDGPQVRLQVFNDNWRAVRDGQRYDLELSFDGRRGLIVSVDGAGIRREAVAGLNVLLDSQTITALERAFTLEIGLRDPRGRIRPIARVDLGGSARALAALADCVRGPLARYSPGDGGGGGAGRVAPRSGDRFAPPGGDRFDDLPTPPDRRRGDPPVAPRDEEPARPPIDDAPAGDAIPI